MILLYLALFAIISLIFLNSIFKNKFSILNIFEFIVMYIILCITYFYELDDFYYIYVILALIFTTQLWIRKKDFKVYNIVATTIMTTFVLTQMTEYSFKMLVSEQVINISYNHFQISIAVMIMTVIVLFTINNLHKRLFLTESPLIDIGVITFNVVILVMILFGNFVILYSNINEGDINTILFLVFLMITLIILFGYFGVFMLEKNHLENVELMNDMKAVNARSNVAYRKNHNTTNIFITVNHMLKLKKYDEVDKYIKEINKGESS